MRRWPLTIECAPVWRSAIHYPLLHEAQCHFDVIDSYNSDVWVYATICSQLYWYLGSLVTTKRTSIASLAKNSSVILAAYKTWSPILHDTSICQCMIVNAWFNMRAEDVIIISVQLDLRECPAGGHCWRIPWWGLPLWGRSLTSLGLAAYRLKMPYALLRGIPRRLEFTGALIPFSLRAIRLQCCCIVVRCTRHT